MKTGSIFFGSFLIVLGGLFLVKNLGIETTSIDSLTKLWPLILIALGVSYLIGNEVIARVLSAVSGVLGGVIVWTLFQQFTPSKVFSFDYPSNSSQTDSVAQVQSLVAVYDGKATRAQCKIEADVGEFILSDTTRHLLKVEAKSNFGVYELRQVRKGDTEEVAIEMQDAEVALGQKMTNKFTLALNPNPIWDIQTDIGAAKVDFDLSSFQVQHIDIESSAASVKLKIGSRCDSVRLNLSAAASTLKLLVPKESGCQIVSEDDFSSKINASGFTKHDKSVLRTQDFEDAPKKIFIVLESGLSNLTIERY
ncbi:MAG: LiaI-LiaF-like domain-containing protein [Chloroherpetonaceae bacterium]